MSKDDTKLDLKSLDIKEDKIKKLKEVFPETVTENKIDFKKLKKVLGEEIDEGKERYGMQWPGKSDCFKIIQQQSVGTLKPDKEESVNFDDTENLFIEGDNLEILKLMQKSYYGKVKMIYIDPPYNTGNDFVYPDDFSETLETYLKYTGQVDAEGKKFSTNTETSGRFHSKWMNMMYPRLYLAKNLLSKDGVMFISIDDTELINLKSICNEIFGQENFVAQVEWQKRYTRSNNTDRFTSVIDHLLIYSKSPDYMPNLLPRTEEADERYSNPDNDPRGVWKAMPFFSQATPKQRPNLTYEIINPNTSEKITPKEKAWRSEKRVFEKYIQENRVWWGSDGKAKYPSIKRFLSEAREGMTPTNFWSYKEAGSTDDANREIKELFGSKIFDTPKPTMLVEMMLKLSTKAENGHIILDFFAGSASTAHAVFDLNKKDGGNRKFIMVQLPENSDTLSEAFKAGFKNIADIGKERIRRVIKKIKDEQDGQLFKKDGLDFGFKVFKLTTSNFKVWDGSSEDIKKQLELSINHIKEGSSKEDILYEILLKTSFELTTPIKEIDIAGKKVYSIEDGGMLVCLEEDITRDLIDEMVKLEPLRVVCMDSGFKNNDQLKTNAVQIMKTKDIEFRTV